MESGIYNYSEIGNLKRVLLHRPGREIEALTPATMERLLFDDVPFLKAAQEEHDCFAKTLVDNGVEVIYYQEETAKALVDPKIRENFIYEMINLSFIESEGMKNAIHRFLMSLSPEKMVEEVIAGIKREDLGEVKTDSLSDLVIEEYPFVMDPMPNLYFTRDPGACIGNGINIHHMHTPARRREALLLKYIFICEMTTKDPIYVGLCKIGSFVPFIEGSDTIQYEYPELIGGDDGTYEGIFYTIQDRDWAYDNGLVYTKHDA